MGGRRVGHHMGLAIPFHIVRGEANVIASHLVVVSVCAFVA